MPEVNNNMEDNKFKMANVLTRAIMPLPQYSKKLFYYSLCVFDEGKLSAKFPLSQFMKDMSIGKQRKNEITTNEAMKQLVLDTMVLIPKEISPTGNKIACSVISDVEYIEESNEIMISRNKKIMPLLDAMKKDYTFFFLDQLIKLDGQYSPKIYQMCRILLQKSRGKIVDFKWYIEPTSTNPYENLKTWLNINDKKRDKSKENSYNNFYKIQNRILIPSIQEINEKCNDCYIEYDPSENKKGTHGKVEYIVLHIKPKNYQIRKQLVSSIKWFKDIPEYREMTPYACEEIAKYIDDLLIPERLNFPHLAEGEELEKVRRGLFRYIYYFTEKEQDDRLEAKEKPIKSKVVFMKKKLNDIIQFGLYKDVYDLNDYTCSSYFTIVLWAKDNWDKSIAEFKAKTNLEYTIFDLEKDQKEEEKRKKNKKEIENFNKHIKR